MLHAAYPTTEEFEAALTESGLREFAPSDVSGALAAAVTSWERNSDWGPFLSSGQEEPRKFTLIGGRFLFLKSGLIEAPTLLTIDGNELTQGETFWLEPANSAPYTKIDFGRKRWSQIQGCTIIGKWGYSSEVPEDVWNAILNKAALSFSDQIQRKWSAKIVADTNASSVLKAKESGPLRMEFQTADGTKTLDLSAPSRRGRKATNAP